MVESRHKIAILMAVYNGEQYLQAQLDSILRQTFQDWELFVHDDGSADKSAYILQVYAHQFPEKIHILDGEPTGGSKYNFLYLMSQVNADYVMFSDQDDVWLNEKIEKTYQMMRKTEKTDKPALVFTDLKVVDEHLNVRSELLSRYQNLKMDHVSFRNLFMQNVVTGCTVMINRKCLEMSRRCDDINEMIMHDWWCALTASCFGTIAAVEEPLILYRQHGDNSVGAKNVHSGAYLKNRLQHKSEIRDTLLKTQKQAGCFQRTFNVKDEGLCAYASFPSYSKARKLQCIMKYGLWKNDLKRNIGLLIYC